MPRAIVLWAILLLGTIAFANGLKCYAACSGPGECEEGVPTTDTPVDCSDQLEDQGVDAASCVKVTTRIEGQLQMASRWKASVCRRSRSRNHTARWRVCCCIRCLFVSCVCSGNVYNQCLVNPYKNRYYRETPTCARGWGCGGPRPSLGEPLRWAPPHLGCPGT